MTKHVFVGKFEGSALEQAMRHLMDKHADEPIAQRMRRATQRLITDVHSKGIARGAVEGINLLTRRRDHDALAAECFRTFQTITSPGAQLLQREGVVRGDQQTGNAPMMVHMRNTWHGVRAVVQAPMILMYGFVHEILSCGSCHPMVITCGGQLCPYRRRMYTLLCAVWGARKAAIQRVYACVCQNGRRKATRIMRP